MQQEVEGPAGVAFLAQDGDDVVIRLAGMDAQRQAGQARGADVAAEILGLRVARGLVVEVVQAGFADADDARVVGLGGDLLGRRQRALAGVVRVDADGAPDLGVALGQFLAPWRPGPCGRRS